MSRTPDYIKGTGRLGGYSSYPWKPIKINISRVYFRFGSGGVLSLISRKNNQFAVILKNSIQLAYSFN